MSNYRDMCVMCHCDRELVYQQLCKECYDTYKLQVRA